ncbi:MAG: helix-turn-helix domain-containing protein, partial [Methanoculleus sp.]
MTRAREAVGMVMVSRYAFERRPPGFVRLVRLYPDKNKRLSCGALGGVAGRPRSRDRGRALRPFVIFPGGYQKEYTVVRTSNACMLRAYKYRMYPCQEQVASLMQHIHACRFVYNKAIQKLARCHEKV